MKNVIAFLENIRDNNNRPWFEEHKEEYQNALETFKELVTDIDQKLSKTDVLEKSKVFRIYRDVRFSKDKLPYKNNMAAYFERASKMRRGGYYIHIQPGGDTFVGGGFWQPEPDDLKRIRDEFAYDHQTISKILKAPQFIKYFGGISTEDALKNPPRGYDKELPGIQLIKQKSFVASRKFTDKEVLSPTFGDEVVKTFETLRPFFDYMSAVLTTNINGEPL
ncbi:MAG: DUF2461 domain-containing protein [Saprospiraceae bacterium]|nr:DUF2461 domain-containing protein [Saprospiraceae bacterium]